MIWETKKVREGEEQELLKEGWEPFGVSNAHGSYPYIDTSVKKERTQLTTTTFIHLRKEFELKDVEAFKGKTLFERSLF